MGNVAPLFVRFRSAPKIVTVPAPLAGPLPFRVRFVRSKCRGDPAPRSLVETMAALLGSAVVISLKRTTATVDAPPEGGADAFVQLAAVLQADVTLAVLVQAYGAAAAPMIVTPHTETAMMAIRPNATVLRSVFMIDCPRISASASTKPDKPNLFHTRWLC